MARHGMHGQGGAASHLLRYLLSHQKDLGLTDEQVTKLKTLSLDRDREKIRAQADVQVAERELRALIRDEKADLSAIEAKVKERSALDATLRFIVIKAKRDLFAVLTPDQREKQRIIFDRMRQSHRARMFSRQGASEADHGEMIGGSIPEPEIGLHDSNGGLPTS
jgi:Spy/CpxP family protein refolding chaperone